MNGEIPAPVMTPQLTEPYPVELRDRVVRGLERVKAQQAERIKGLGLPAGTPELVEEEEMNEPFYLVDLEAVYELHQRWRAALPCVEPYYAVKCNPNAAVLELLNRLGTGFDCASSDEIDRVAAMGVGAERIVFANPCKMSSQIEHARTRGVRRMTFDNADELVKVAQHYPGAEMILRIVTDDSHSLCRFSSKFGAPLRTVPGILAAAAKLGVSVVGVSFHVGSGCADAAAFAAAARDALAVFAMGKDYGFEMSVLDIGGGFQGVDKAEPPLELVAAHLLPVLAQFPPGTRFIAEPGRYFVARSHTLVANIHSRRLLTDDATGRVLEALYYINDGVYHSFNCIFFDHQHPFPLTLLVPGTPDAAARPLVPSTVFGPTCDSLDCICKDIPMPLLSVGEWLFFRDMGAYTSAAMTRFNGFPGAVTTLYTWGNTFLDDALAAVATAVPAVVPTAPTDPAPVVVPVPVLAAPAVPECIPMSPVDSPAQSPAVRLLP